MHGKSKLETFAVVLSVLLTAVLAVTPAKAAEGNPAETIVDGLQKSYDATADFVADFQQETEVKNLNRTLKAHGKLSFKRPVNMLWHY